MRQAPANTKRMAYRGLMVVLGFLGLVTLGLATLWGAVPAMAGTGLLALVALSLFWTTIVGLAVDLTKKDDELDSQRW